MRRIVNEPLPQPAELMAERCLEAWRGLCNDYGTQVDEHRRAKPVMNSFTYMRSELDCVWQIPYELATMRWRRLIGFKAMPRAMLIFQYLEAPTQSASIRTGVNEMMTRFGRVQRSHLDRETIVAALGATGQPIKMLSVLQVEPPLLQRTHPGGLPPCTATALEE
jgi:hypothetical protein